MLLGSLDDWGGSLDILGGLALVLREILEEEATKLLDFSIEAIVAGGPSLFGVEEV